MLEYLVERDLYRAFSFTFNTFQLIHLTVNGKGGKVHEIGIRNDLMEMIKDYLSSDRKESRFHESEYHNEERKCTGSCS